MSAPKTYVYGEPKNTYRGPAFFFFGTLGLAASYGFSLTEIGQKVVAKNFGGKCHKLILPIAFGSAALGLLTHWNKKSYAKEK